MTGHQAPSGRGSPEVGAQLGCGNGRGRSAGGCTEDGGRARADGGEKQDGAASGLGPGAGGEVEGRGR